MHRILSTVWISLFITQGASAATIEATFPGADFSSPGAIGTFSYALPSDFDVQQVLLFSPQFSFPESGSRFGLQFDLDGVPWSALVLPQEGFGNTFFLGSDATSQLPQMTDGSLEVSVSCFFGECPTNFSFIADGEGGNDWRLLFLGDEVPQPVPLPGTLGLLGIGLAGLLGFGRRKTA